MKQQWQMALTCTGAVIGAGFASGREVVVFFSRYGRHAWWLIVLTSLLMAALGALCMKKALSRDACAEWNKLLNHTMPGRWCSLSLLVLTSGAMLAAAGHTVALMLPMQWAYQQGLLGTLLLAWWLGNKCLSGLRICSALLLICMLGALIMVLFYLPEPAVHIQKTWDFTQLVVACVSVLGYSAMNMTLAMGVVCKCAEKNTHFRSASLLFGLIVGTLLLLSHWVYTKAGLSDGEIFPMVSLLATFGRKGFYGAGILLYLSINTIKFCKK